MATTTQLARPVRVATPAALWHLLSLDAPTVAMLWAWFIARASHIHLPAAAPAAMALAVWIVYAADRLLDARVLDARPLHSHSLRSSSQEAAGLEERHYFHHRHRRAFAAGIAVAAAALVALLPLLDPAALRLYLVEGALLAVWFVILHATPSAHRLPKEIAVGLFFSAAVFTPAVAREPALRPALAPAATLFAALCSLNCLFIYAWEHPPSASPHLRSGAKPAHATTRIALAYLPELALAAVAAGLALTLFSPAILRPIAACCSLSAILLLLLDRNRALLSRTHLRAAADLALLTPLLLMPMLEFLPR